MRLFRCAGTRAVKHGIYSNRFTPEKWAEVEAL